MGRRDLEAPLFSASRHARAGRAQRAAVRWSLEESLEEANTEANTESRGGPSKEK